MTPISGSAAFVGNLSHGTFGSIRMVYTSVNLLLPYRHGRFPAQANEGANASRCRPLSEHDSRRPW